MKVNRIRFIELILSCFLIISLYLHLIHNLNCHEKKTLLLSYIILSFSLIECL